MRPESTMRPSGERGMALVIALLVLLVLSLLATMLMVSVNVETKIAGHGLRETSALNVAEAGIGEAQARIADGTLTAALAENPVKVTEIFNALPGSVPVPGVDTTGFATAQPSGAWLPYSRPTPGPGVLTIEYKTNTARDVLYRFSPSSTPPVHLGGSGWPVYRITSTGAIGADRRTIQTEIYALPVPVNVYGAVVAQVGIDLGGTIHIDGHNHSSAMPSGTEGAATDPYHLDPITDVPGVVSSDVIDHHGTPDVQGSSPAEVSNWVGPYAGNPPTGFYRGPWDVFSMTQSQFFQWMGAPVASPPDPVNGLVYVDGDAAIHGSTGTGILYVSGDLTINATFTYRGLVYVKGDLKVNGTVWILGGLVVEGQTKVDLATGNAEVYYSADMISQAASQAGGNFTRLSWRELP